MAHPVHCIHTQLHAIVIAYIIARLFVWRSCITYTTPTLPTLSFILRISTLLYYFTAPCESNISIFWSSNRTKSCTEIKILLNQKHFFQKHVYHGFKSICYRISNIFIGSCSIFLWINSINAFGKKCFWFNIIFFSVCVTWE